MAIKIDNGVVYGNCVLTALETEGVRHSLNSFSCIFPMRSVSGVSSPSAMMQPTAQRSFSFATWKKKCQPYLISNILFTNLKHWKHLIYQSGVVIVEPNASFVWGKGWRLVKYCTTAAVRPLAKFIHQNQAFYRWCSCSNLYWSKQSRIYHNSKQCQQNYEKKYANTNEKQRKIGHFRLIYLSNYA